MALLRHLELTYSELAALDRATTVAALPVGAIEAHGPHLPLGTDVIIAEQMVMSAAQQLADIDLLGLPPIAETPAPFAANFPGTVSATPEILTGRLIDLGRALDRHGFRYLAVANAHFDPANIQAIRRGVEQIHTELALRVAFPDVTRTPWAERLTEEFRSGACHAGRYEGSIVLAVRSDLVRSEVAARLIANPRSIAAAIREGQRTFEEAGGPDAYFGDPAAATAAEGRQTLSVLGRILADAIGALLTARPANLLD